MPLQPVASARHARHRVVRWAAAVGGTLAVLTLGTSVPADASPAPVPALSAWPMALHDLRHSGTSPAVGPQSGHVEWSRDLGANITPGPVVGADGTVYVATNAGVLYALDPSTGRTRWTFQGGGPLGGAVDLSVSPLVLPSGSILWPGPRGTLFEISPTGQLLFTHAFGAPLTSPVLSGDTVYLGTADGSLDALDVRGPVPVLRWSLSVGHSSYGSPVVAPDGRIVTTADNCVVDVADEGSHGTIAWFHRFHGQVETSAAVSAGGTIVVGTNDPYEYGFSPGGRVVWRVRRGAESYSSPSVSPGGRAYFGANNGLLRVVSAGSGAPVVTLAGRMGLWAAQAVDARGDTYFGTQGRRIYGFDRQGRRLFVITASGPIDSYPALTATGELIIGDEAGTLYAVGP